MTRGIYLSVETITFSRTQHFDEPSFPFLENAW